jgi:hypothetical protein
VRLEASSYAAGRKGTAGTTFGRSVCGVTLGGAPVQQGCLTDDGMRQIETAVRDRFAGHVEIRFNKPVDPVLFKGTPSGYQAAVQRDRLDRFGDQMINRDNSLAVPALEVMFYRGDSQKNGPGRQILQFAGVQVNASYGIACLYGESADGGCEREPNFGDDDSDDDDSDDDESDGSDMFASAGDSGDSGDGFRGAAALADRPSRGGLRGALDRLLQLPVDVARLLFSNPREFGLMAAVWALLYAPCYLGERRRTLRRVGSARLRTG